MSVRRKLPYSPFNAEPPPPLVQHFAVDDLVNHDTYGLGRVVSVEPEIAVTIDFNPTVRRFTIPDKKVSLL